MCGITGLLDLDRQAGADALAVSVTRMADAIRHRGPDDSGAWADPACGIALGFRRLAIIDLSATGHQPMLSASGRYVIVFNGEVYNFESLRAELSDRGQRFRGSSDTEVMLAAIEEWGLLQAVTRFNGMFAFALWDRREQRLHLVRDRLGIKPLYYGWMGRMLLFGSELKALRAHPAFRAEVDRDALALYLRHDAVPAPYSIYEGVRKLEPGSILTIEAAADQPGGLLHPYWSVQDTAERGSANPFESSPAEAVDRLEALLRESIRERMVADVPLGAFLSGGVDSSAIVALMQAQSSRPVKTFTIGFHEWGYDEAAQARAIAAHLGCEHTELVVTPRQALEVIPRLPLLYDEPFADSSQIPTFLVAQLTRQSVTVSLSGDGGDELFGGYNRYLWDESFQARLNLAPRWARRLAVHAIQAVPPRRFDSLFQKAGPLLPASLRVPYPGDKLHKLAGLISKDTPQQVYLDLVSHWKDPARVVLGAHEPPTALTDRARWPNLPGFVPWMMAMDQVTYLPDDILTKVDRASMAVSLEARVPFLDDERLLEFAWRLPLSMKIQGETTKWILRQVLYRYVTPALIERPKQGFSIPLDSWLRGPLRDWAETLLDEQRLAREGFFDPAPIRQKWAAHLDGKQNWQYDLWDVLMFQAWLESPPPQGPM